MKEKQQLFSFCGVVAYRQMVCVLLVSGLGIANTPSAQAQDVVTEVNTIFYNRLENTLRYQEAVLPSGRSVHKQYLQIGKRRFLLESLRTYGPSGSEFRIQENYLLNASAHDTLNLNTAKYRLNANREVEGRQLAGGWFHTFPLSGPGEAGEFLLLQEFSPWNLLRLQPGNAQSGQAVYVRNAAFDFSGDTIACYTLTREGNEYTMVFEERLSKGRRRWQHNTATTCSWVIDLDQRQVSATYHWQDSHVAQSWKRTYTNTTDFSEICTGITLPEEGADEPVRRIRIRYSRRFQQKSPTRSMDSYTVPSIDKTEPAIIFSIVSHYE